MISLTLIRYVSIGTIAMLLPVLLLSWWYRIKWYKSLLITFLLTISGTIGTYVLFYIENGWIGGTSFYGAVFLVPVLFIPVAKLVKLPYGTLMDLCAPAECIMLVIMKVQCVIYGCCGGRELSVAGNVFRFPSQYAEMINAFVLMIVLMLLSRKRGNRGSIYPWYMAIYGVTRFVLNLLRQNNTPFALGLSAGCFWSVWSVIFGTAGLVLWYRKKKQEAATS